MSISSSEIHSVRIARFSTDVNAMSNGIPSAFSSLPASWASSNPCFERSTSIQPVNRFSRFQMLWPWRSRTSLPVLMFVGSSLDEGMVRFL